MDKITPPCAHVARKNCAVQLLSRLFWIGLEVQIAISMSALTLGIRNLK